MGIEVVKDEADKRPYEPFKVLNRKEGYEYRLLNKNAHNLERRAHEGYEIVQGSDPEKLMGLNANNPMKQGSDLDTTRQFHDVILARIPKELADKRRRFVKDLTSRRTAAASAEFFKEAGDKGFEGGGGTGWSGSMDEAEFNAKMSKGGKK